MRTILCYGDSNTWGWNPSTMTRYSPSERWTGVLSRRLDESYRVIEAGLNARTTAWDDPLEPHRNGAHYLPVALLTHMPLDIVIIMLGTNDIKTRFGLSTFDIAEGAGLLVDIVQRSQTGRDSKAPHVLLVAPPPIKDVSAFAEGRPEFAGTEATWQGSIEKSQRFSTHYARVADARGCSFLDASSIIESSPIDGIHWSAESHRVFGEAVADWLLSRE